jgi:nucleoside-diphosphate-sugar epimerase
MATDIKGSHAVILGGSGFVGPVLVSRLLKEGVHITLINRGSRLVEGTCLVIADRNDDRAMAEAGSRLDCVDWLIDLSCYNSTQAKLAWSSLSPKTPRWIHLSSAAVYSDLPSMAPTEDAAIGGAPIWESYGREKADVDKFLLDTSGNTEVVILRPPYFYGPGNDNDRETFVWSRALRGRPVLIPGDGETPIQFLHVEDFADAVVHVLRHSKAGHHVYNVAKEEELALREFVRRTAAICGADDPSIVIGPAAEGYRARQYFPFRDYPCRVDPSRIRDECGWTARYDFVSGLTETYRTYDPIVLRMRPLETDVEDHLIERFGHLRAGDGQ